MQMTQLARHLVRSDAKLIFRDRFLIFMLFFIVYIAGALRFLLPWANTYLADNGVLPNEFVSQSLSDFYPLIIAYMAFFTGALLVGVIIGFVLLDEKENNTLKAMLVTPVPLNQYLQYRVGGPVLIAFFVVLAMVLVIDQALLPLWQLTLISAGAAFTAPIASLFFAILAENKVEGFAYSKFVGVAGWVIMIGWFVPVPWQWLMGLLPPFWISKAYWMALEENGWWWVALIIGVVSQLGLIRWMMKRFNRVVYG